MQPTNQQYVQKPFGRLPYDLQRHIMTKFLDKDDRKQYAIDLLYTDWLKFNLKLLPQSVIVKLFINSIYNKCHRDLYNQSGSAIQVGTKSNHRRKVAITMPGPISQYLQYWLDTIYYGFSTSSELENKKPIYSFDVIHPELITYTPTEGHDRLTTNIQIDDFVRFIHMFVHLGDPIPQDQTIYTHTIPSISRQKCNKVWIEKRNTILYEFTVILQYLANKYRNYTHDLKIANNIVKEKAKLDQVAAKEKARLDKVAAKEKATLDKAAEREKAKLDKIASIEKLKLDKAAIREQAKLDKIVQKRELNSMKFHERETHKYNKSKNLCKSI